MNNPIRGRQYENGHVMPPEAPLHPYKRSPHSGAGNCECGMAEHSRSHPHAFAQWWKGEVCVCMHPANHPIHTDAATAKPKPVLRGTEAVRQAVRRARGEDAVPQGPVTFICR